MVGIVAPMPELVSLMIDDQKAMLKVEAGSHFSYIAEMTSSSQTIFSEYQD
jgi:hypothetical protein